MNGVLNENVIVKAYEIDKTTLSMIDSIIGACIRDCHHKYFHKFDHICEYDIRFTKISNIEIINLTISGKSMNLYELNENLTVA